MLFAGVVIDGEGVFYPDLRSLPISFGNCFGVVPGIRCIDGYFFVENGLIFDHCQKPFFADF